MADRKNVAIITGGGSGLGQATAYRLARQGVKIAIVDVVEQGGNETVAAIKQQGGEAVFIKADVSKAEQVKHYVDKTVEAFGPVTMFFNNAGISGPGKLFADNSIEEIDRVIGINMQGALYGLKYVLEVMLANGGGSIVNTSSSAGVVGVESVGTYSATKHGIVGITKTIAVEYARKGIRINAVAPGTTETPMVRAYREAHPAVFEQNMQGIPQRRVGQPEEVAALVAFLLGEDAGYINGVTVPIDGGYTAQ